MFCTIIYFDFFEIYVILLICYYNERSDKMRSKKKSNIQKDDDLPKAIKQMKNKTEEKNKKSKKKHKYSNCNWNKYRYFNK